MIQHDKIMYGTYAYIYIEMHLKQVEPPEFLKPKGFSSGTRKTQSDQQAIWPSYVFGWQMKVLWWSNGV